MTTVGFKVNTQNLAAMVTDVGSPGGKLTDRVQFVIS